MDDNKKSLLFHLLAKKLSGLTRDQLSGHAADFAVFLADNITVSSANLYWKQMSPPGGQFLPLEQFRAYLPAQWVDLAKIGPVTDSEYAELLDIAFPQHNVVQQANPQPAVPDWYDDYVESMPTETERQSLREDVDSIYCRIMANVDPNHPDRQPDPDGESRVECVEGLMNPERKDRASGLVVGRVQSGKTRNYIGLALKAFCNDWNVVIVLTSNNTALARQTDDRLDQDIILRAGNGVQRLSDISNGKVKWRQSVHFTPQGKYLGLALKEKNHLKDIERWLDKVDDLSLSQMRILVIDDEADSSTPDTQSGRRQDFGAREFNEYIQSFPISGRGDDTTGFVGDWLWGLKLGFELNDGRVDEESLDADMSVSAIGKEVAKVLCQSLQDDEVSKDFPTLFQQDDDRIIQDVQSAHQDQLGLNLEAETGSGQKIALNQCLTDYLGNAGNKARKNICAALRFLFDVELNRSVINHEICKIVSRTSSANFAYGFGRAAYVGYTATPVANLVNETSPKNPLAPDFAFSMQVPGNYFGFKRIFGESRQQGDSKPNMPIVHRIQGREEKEILDPLRKAKIEKAFLTRKRDKQPALECEINRDLDLIDSSNRQTVCSWDSLKAAIAYTFVAAAIRSIRNAGRDERVKRWTTLLINVNMYKPIHRKLQTWIYKFLENVRDDAGARQTFKALCADEIKEMRNFGRDDFNQLFPGYAADYGAVADYPGDQEIDSGIDGFLTRMKGGLENRDLGNVHVCNINSDEGDRNGQEFNGVKNLELYRDENLNGNHIWILCGGNTISRGLTLDGLVASYFNRLADTTPSDTVTQMGRWFGYRMGYELLPRAWMTSDTIAEMKNICREEEYLHRNIKSGFEAGHSPKNGEHAIEIMQSVGRAASSRMAAFMVASEGFNSPTGTFNCLRDDPVRVDAFMHTLANCFCTVAGQRRQNAHNCLYYEDVPANAIVPLLGSALDIVTNEMAGAVESLICEVGHYLGTRWDIVVNSSASKNAASLQVGNMLVRVSNRQCERLGGNGVGFRKIQNNTYQGNFGAIEAAILTRAECNLLKRKMAQPFWNEFPDADGFRTKVELNQHIEDVLRRLVADSSVRLDDAVRNFSPFGLSRMSSEAYRDEVFSVFKAANKGENHRPILQITFVLPTNGGGLAVTDSFPVLSYYWPGHPVQGFLTGDNNRRLGPVDDTLYIAAKIREILNEYHVLGENAIKEKLREYAGQGNAVADAAIGKALKFNRNGFAKLPRDIVANLGIHFGANVYYSMSWCPARIQFWTKFSSEVRSFVQAHGVQAFRGGTRWTGLFQGAGNMDAVLAGINQVP